MFRGMKFTIRIDFACTYKLCMNIIFNSASIKCYDGVKT